MGVHDVEKIKGLRLEFVKACGALAIRSNRDGCQKGKPRGNSESRNKLSGTDNDLGTFGTLEWFSCESDDLAILSSASTSNICD